MDLERIQGVPSYILLLYLISERENLGLNENHFKILIRYLTSYFVRRNITDFPSTRNLARIFMDAISLSKEFIGDQLVSEIKGFLKSQSSSDEQFERRLRGSLYLDNPDATRFILCYYENKFMTDETRRDLWIRDNNNKFKWTIEHVFPEGKNIPNEWVDMIANGDREKADEYLQEYAHTLGNLTITGYNQNLSNLSFEKKKERTDKAGLKIGYLNGLKLNEDLADKTAWTIDDIKTRTDKLVGFFVSEFTL